jgi:hypothetical protein
MNLTIIATNADKSPAYFLIHKTGCKDIAAACKKYHGFSQELVIETVDQAIVKTLENYEGFGFTKEHFKVIGCVC